MATSRWWWLVAEVVDGGWSWLRWWVVGGSRRTALHGTLAHVASDDVRWSTTPDGSIEHAVTYSEYECSLFTVCVCAFFSRAPPLGKAATCASSIDPQR
jgi:hypothetical protein